MKRIQIVLSLVAIAAVLTTTGCPQPCQCPPAPPPTVCPDAPPPPPPPPPPPTCEGETYEEWMDLGGTRIVFDNGSETLSPEARRLLTDMVASVRTRTDVIRVRVRGHTDSRGRDGANEALSLMRAQTVVQFLISLGVPETMLEATGEGSRFPLADESSPTERELNRRVDFQVLVRRCRGAGMP